MADLGQLQAERGVGPKRSGDARSYARRHSWLGPGNPRKIGRSSKIGADKAEHALYVGNYGQNFEVPGLPFDAEGHLDAKKTHTEESFRQVKGTSCQVRALFVKLGASIVAR